MTDLITVTVSDGKYTIRQIGHGKWECLRHGEPWPAFEGRQPDNLHTALATEVDRLHDQVEGLNSDLDSAVEVAFRRGATEWVRLNYPTHFDRLSAGPPTPSPDLSLSGYANRLFNLHGFMLLEEYRGKPAVTITFPDQAEANQFHRALCELSRHRSDKEPSHE